MRKNPFVALRKSDFIFVEYGWKSELSHKFGLKFPTSNLNTFCDVVYKIYMETRLSYGSIWLKILTFRKTFTEILLYEISTMYVKRFIR